MKYTQEQFEREKNIHKHGGSNYEIIVPDAKESEFADYIIFANENEHCKSGWAKFSWKDTPKRVYEKLIVNFQREKGDIKNISHPDFFYVLVGSLLGPRMSKTKNYKYLGFISISDGGIELCWLHPYLRNKGIMQTFLFHYSLNEGPLCLKPPISKPMLACAKKVAQRLIDENKIDSVKKMQLSYLQNKFKNIDINENNLSTVLSAYEFYALSNDLKDSMDVEKFLEMALKGQNFINTMPMNELDNLKQVLGKVNLPKLEIPTF